MDNTEQKISKAGNAIDDPILSRALNELGRSINLVTTYGTEHPVARKALTETTQAMQELFTGRKKISIGAFNGIMTVDEKTIQTCGTLQKSLERRLVRLNITGLKISRGTTEDEFGKLADLLATSDADAFHQNLGGSGMDNITSEDTRFQAVHEGQTVANESDLTGMGGAGVLVLEDEAATDSAQGSSLHVEQIVAFLKGDIDSPDAEVGAELAEMASDPDKLGRMIMESVAIRQSTSDLSGESLNDIVLGCLRRTYSGLRKQSAFQSQEGKADLKKALLLLEESILDKMRSLSGEDNPELDRQIVQAVRDMDETLGFEIAAAQYMEHSEAIQQSKDQLSSFIRTQGTEAAEDLLEGSGFPGNDWRRIVVESGKQARQGSTDISEGLSKLTAVFEKLEQLVKSDETDGSQVKDLLGQATENLGDTLGGTKEKLQVLSSTIGGQGKNMSRDELLASLAEVAQELMQPLTAINASVEMMLGGFVGDISEEQQDLLKLASGSGEHLKYLMDMLIEIVGCPANKGVDDRFHTTSEQVQLLKDNTGMDQRHVNLS
jgi:hypothetical protein